MCAETLLVFVVIKQKSNYPKLRLPPPAGLTVRNIQAFAVLQNAFLRTKTGRLASMLLDAIGSIYSGEPANYFILESQHTLSQFAERVAQLPAAQAKYFELLEFVVFGLNYVPCKELFGVSVLLKSGSTSHACSIVAVTTLLKLCRHDAVFSDVLREVGLLEVLVNLLHKYAALLKDPAAAPQHQSNEPGEGARARTHTHRDTDTHTHIDMPTHAHTHALTHTYTTDSHT